MQTKQLLKSGAKISGSFFDGLFANLKAFSILKQYNGLKKYYAMPLIINIIVLTLMVIGAYLFLEPRITALLGTKKELIGIQADTFFLIKWIFMFINWLFSLIKAALSIVLVILLIFGAVLCYSFLGAIIASFFLDILSQKVEELITGARFEDDMSIGEMLKDIARVLKNTIKLVLYTIFLTLLLMPINIIPVIGPIAYTVLSFLVMAYFLGFQFFDLPLERRRLVFKEKMAVLKKCKLLVCGLGTGFFFISFVPVVGFLGLNNATIGATKLFIDYIKPALNESDS